MIHLLINGTGRTDFQSGSPYDAVQFSYLVELLKLPDKYYWYYPAHDYNGKSFSTIRK